MYNNRKLWEILFLCNTCDSCKAGYRPSEDKKSCIVIGEDHCYSYTTGDDGTTQICTECQPGYKKNIDNSCEVVVAHCLYSHFEGDDLKCIECENGYAIITATNSLNQKIVWKLTRMENVRDVIIK